MSSTYPSIVATLTDPQATDKLNSPSHSAIERAQNAEIVQVETVLGTASSVIGTIIGDLRNPASNGGGHVQTANKGGTGQTSYAKGDILAAMSSSVLSKVSVGVDGAILQADSSQSAGVKWAIGTLVLASTTFETAGRFSVTNVNTGATTFGTNGAIMTTGASATSSSNLLWALGTNFANGAFYNGNPIITARISIVNIGAADNPAFFVGNGQMTVAGAGITFTDHHAGFKLVRVSGSTNLYATNADGSTEKATLLSSALANADVLDLICTSITGSSYTYFFRKNGGALSAATVHNVNLPTSNSGTTASISNSGASTTLAVDVENLSYAR